MARLAEQVQGERQARMVLSMIAEPDDPATGRVLGRVGSVETLRLIEDHRAAVPGMNRADALAWRDRLTTATRPEVLIDRMRQAEAAGIDTVIPADTSWPGSLDVLGARAPYVLWTRGADSFLSRPLLDFVAIVGSRASTSYGELVAGEFAADFARDDRVIVGGGSYGIEAAAHRAALASGGSTIAVLASGVDRPYPAGNRDLLDQVADVGLLVSEVPPGETPSRHRFQARGRLMAALSSVTILVEAGTRSGAMRLAEQAHDLGRRVGAVPGPVTSATSTGPHRLLQERRGELVTDASQIINMLHMTEALNEAPTGSLLGSRFRSAPPPQRSTDTPTL